MMRLSSKSLGLFLGPIFFLGFLSWQSSGLDFAQRGVAGLTLWMMTWWILESIPLYATSLLPIIILPGLTPLGVGDVTRIFGSDIIFLFFGGFVLSIALEKWRVHEQLAVRFLPLFGNSPSRILMGFILITAFLSMWISNTATAFMMLPIALAVAASSKSENLEKALLFGVAYAASIGGVATIIGSPPNAILLGYLRQNEAYDISFLGWMKLCLGFSALFLLILWKYLCARFFKDLKADLKISLPLKETWSKVQIRVLIVFALTAGLWISRPFLGIDFLSDTGIAIAASLVLFVLPAPSGRILDFDAVQRIPWGVLLLFGGGLALAQGFQTSGLGEWIAQQLSGLSNWPLIFTFLLIGGIVVFFTEIGSNTAVASLFIPIVGALAPAIAPTHAFELLLVTCLASSLSFMLPMATPPNAIIFHSRLISIKEMARMGFALNLIAILLICLFGLFVFKWLA